MINFAKNLKEYTSKLVDLYRKESINREMNQYRIVEIGKDNTTLWFQVVGTGVILKTSLDELMRSEYLMQFTKADIALITYLGTKQELKNQKPEMKFFKILRQFLRKDKTSFLIEKEEGIVEEHSAHDIYTNPAVSEKLTGTDAMKVGYSIAEEHYHKILTLKERA